MEYPRKFSENENIINKDSESEWHKTSWQQKKQENEAVLFKFWTKRISNLGLETKVSYQWSIREVWRNVQTCKLSQEATCIYQVEKKKQAKYGILKEIWR